MTILKKYVAVWCQQNGGQGSFAEKDVNDAVTEQLRVVWKEEDENQDIKKLRERERES